MHALRRDENLIPSLETQDNAFDLTRRKSPGGQIVRGNPQVFQGIFHSVHMEITYVFQLLNFLHIFRDVI